jgi:tRNA(Ile)-lysidine synthase
VSVAAKLTTPELAVSAVGDVLAPICAEEFDVCMQRLGPFEDAPHLAVGVSGGRDSLALVLLAAEWAAARRGRVTAVTIDHGLRTASAAEAMQVSAWMAQQGIPHHTIEWQGSSDPGAVGTPANAGASEAAARSARYALLEAFCREQNILHLLVGHHRQDQLETQAMRLARSSGAFGRAGMAAVRELSHTRVLRPFLDIPRARITDTLQARAQTWIEDPSNRDMRYARARLRSEQQTAGPAGLDPEMAQQRVAREREIARFAARAVAIHPAGFATLDPTLLDAADRETAVRLIANLVTCIGGRDYGPRGARLIRLADRLMDDQLGSGATLGGCILRSDGRGKVRVVREQAAIEPPRHVDGFQAVEWDRRFRLAFAATYGVDANPATDGVTKLGAVGYFLAHGVPMHSDSPCYDALPRAIRMTLPAIFRDGCFHICAMPFSAETGHFGVKARFAPRNPVAGTIFATG